MTEAAKPPRQDLGRGPAIMLLVSVFVIAGCGLGYELVAGTMASYLLGDSVTQFSIVIGLFLTSMGIGAFLSRYVKRNLIRAFLAIEIAVGVIGGIAPLILFFSFAVVDNYTPMLIGSCVAIGTLVGLEIPLLVRILRTRFSLRAAVGNALAVDYIGAFAASLLFPLVLVPNLGLVRTGALFGLFNVTVAVIGLWVFRSQLARRAALSCASAVAIVLLGVILVTAGRATRMLEDMLYSDDIVYAETTRYQRIVVTRWRDDVRMFINGNIQFSSKDEFRYHESLVHPALGLVREPRTVLILGGGDGMAAREVLAHDSVTRIDLVDLDPAVTRLFSRARMLRELNDDSLRDPSVNVINEDAFKFLETNDSRYDVIIVDLPDPNTEALAKLYSRSFYRLIGRALAPHGVMVTQATSPFYSTSAFWCIVETIRSSDLAPGSPTLSALPYWTSVPSFGDWGFVIASWKPRAPSEIRLDVPTRFLSREMLPGMFVFPKDVARREVPINRLDDPVLVELYRAGYAQHVY